MTSSSPILLNEWENAFNKLSDRLIDSLQGNEYLSLELEAENSHFIRFNNAKVRQSGIVIDSNVKLKLIHNQRTNYAIFPLTGNLDHDLGAALENLAHLRQEITQLPEDPYLVLPENKGSSREVYQGRLLPTDGTVSEILPRVQGLDFTGFYTSGSVIRANYHSLAQKHWFATDSFFLDYSLISPSHKAVKCILAERNWDSLPYQEQIERAKEQLQLLEKPVHKVQPGRYRTYLAPAAVANLIGMFSWGGISEASLQQGGSALAQMREGKTLSPQFNLRENFEGGHVPRFNDLGEMTPAEIPLIVEGELVNTLISSRTAAEYGLVSNGASNGEGLRSPEVSPGHLKQEEILKTLERGLFVSNLHYLNWSDRPGGRITGMTRYACFWVEDGEIVAPIQDLRFDDSLYSFLGPNLLALTETREYIPKTDTYEKRSLGGLLMPGLLVEDFTFTL
jgi:predicted Zn-dependent protease